MKIARYIIGLVSGFTFGMLFAPKKGKDLRDELLKKSSKSGSETLEALGSAFRGAGKDALDELKSISESEQVSAFLSLSKDKMKNFLETAEEKGYDVASVLQDKLDYVSAFVKEKGNSASGVVDKVKKAVPVKKKKAVTKAKAKPKAKAKLVKVKKTTSKPKRKSVKSTRVVKARSKK